MLLGLIRFLFILRCLSFWVKSFTCCMLWAFSSIYFETNFGENLEIEYGLTYPNNNVAATWWHLYCPIGHSQKEDETIPLSSRNICNIMNFYYFLHSEVYLTLQTSMSDGCVYQSFGITVCRVRELCSNLAHAMVYIYTEFIIYWWNWCKF